MRSSHASSTAEFINSSSNEHRGEDGLVSELVPLRLIFNSFPCWQGNMLYKKPDSCGSSREGGDVRRCLEQACDRSGCRVARVGWGRRNGERSMTRYRHTSYHVNVGFCSREPNLCGTGVDDVLWKHKASSIYQTGARKERVFQLLHKGLARKAIKKSVTLRSWHYTGLHLTLHPTEIMDNLLVSHVRMLFQIPCDHSAKKKKIQNTIYTNTLCNIQHFCKYKSDVKALSCWSRFEPLCDKGNCNDTTYIHVRYTILCFEVCGNWGGTINSCDGQAFTSLSIVHVV